MVSVFAVPVFFIVFRETLEASIIVALILGFLKNTLVKPNEDPKVYKDLRKQVWLGTGIGILLCLIIAAGIIGAFYGLKKSVWSSNDLIWEGVFSLIASIIITLMGAAMLRVNKMQDRWRAKLAESIDKPRSARKWTEKYFFLILPLITILREGIEAIVFVGGVGLSFPASAFPLPVIIGLLTGSVVGYLIYKGTGIFKMQIFLIICTCFLYLVAAGLFSRAVWDFEMYKYSKLVGGDVAETGAGPGSYDIRNSAWHVNCCSPNYNGGSGWGIFNALLGWQNSATYGSVISYCLYWVTVMIGLTFLLFREKKHSVNSDDRRDSSKGSHDESVEGKREGVISKV